MLADEDILKWLQKRKASLVSRRKPFEPRWEELRANFEPTIGVALSLGDGDGTDHDETNAAESGEDARIVSSLPRILLSDAAKGLASGITNQSQQWFRFRAKSPEQRERLAKWLQQVTELVTEEMQRSNIYTSLDEMYMHLPLMGTSAAVLQADGDGGACCSLEVCDEGDYWIAEDRNRRVTVMLRRIAMTSATVRETFGEKVPTCVKDDLEDGRDETSRTVWNLICRRGDAEVFDGVDKTKLFASFYWMDVAAQDGLLGVRAYGYNPIIAPRWEPRAGSAYGVGLGEKGLADAKELHFLEEAKAKIANQDADPSLLVHESLRQTAIATAPGGITYYRAVNDGTDTVPVRRLYEVGKGVESVQLVVKEVENRLSRIFMANLFSMMMQLSTERRQMTAREVNELSSEKVSMLGPVLTRLNTDLLTPLTDGVYAILQERGIIPEPPACESDEEFDAEYISSLHVEMMSTQKMRAIYAVFEAAGTVAQLQIDQNPSLDKIDADQVLDEVAQSYPTSSAFIRTDEDVAQRRVERAETEERQRQAMEMEQQARALKEAGAGIQSLANAPTRNGNALERLEAATDGALKGS